MLISTNVIGSGTEDDPYRASFPTYRLIAINYAAKRCIIDVSDDILPSEFVQDAAATYANTAHGRVRISTSATILNRLHQWFDDNYREHAGRFRPEVQTWSATT
jgi:hypothetical protein